jgi:uncharacterized cupredoxin-like copper-binding protein
MNNMLCRLILVTGTLFCTPVIAHDGNFQSSQFGEPGKPSQVDRVVKIEIKNMRFDPSQISVKSGETIRFFVTNSDQIDHEFVIGDAASQAEHRKEMAEMMTMGHVMKHTDPNAVSVTTGETKTLVWKFSRSGKFEIDCNVAGHFEAGMSGIVDVIPAN